MLACAPSNIAVDNLVERLAGSSPKLKIIRLGHPARLVSTVLQYSLDSILAATDGSDIVMDVRKEMSSAWVSHLNVMCDPAKLCSLSLLNRVKLVLLNLVVRDTSGGQKQRP